MADPNSTSEEVAALRLENERLRKSLQQTSQLLSAQKDEFVEQLKQKNHKIDSLQHQLQMALRRIYGRSSEKFDPQQALLFEDLLDKHIPEIAVEEGLELPKPSKNGKHKGHGRRQIPADLPREKVIHDLPDKDKPCPCCGKLRHIIGKETHEQLDYVPAKVKVIQHIRLKYQCPRCEEDVSSKGPQITVAEKPLQPIEKGLAAPGLLSYVIVSKYGDHLPLYRLEGILKRHKIDIARSTMCGWVAQCADILRPLNRLMKERILQSKVIHTDDTPVQVQDRNLDKTRKGRFWTYLGDEDYPYNVFDYTPSRNRDGPMNFLRDWGKDNKVYLQADAFGGYDGIYAGKAGGQVTEVACWAHARRKFCEAEPSDPVTSAQALARIRLLYDIESEAKELAETEGCDLYEARYRLRQERSVSLLEEFKSWIEGLRAENGGHVLPKSPMGTAIQYALNQWEALKVYATNGRLAIDNNASERAVRRIAIGRKNWLFAGSDRGGKSAAIMFGLIATCQRHEVEPYAYLCDVLTRIASTPINRLEKFLPDRWHPKNKN